MITETFEEKLNDLKSLSAIQQKLKSKIYILLRNKNKSLYDQEGRDIPVIG